MRRGAGRVWPRGVLALGALSGSFGCTLLVTTSDLRDSAVSTDGATPPHESGSRDGNPSSSEGGGATDAPTGSTPTGCKDGTFLFCDDFDTPGAPNSLWQRNNPVRDGGLSLDPGAFVSPPRSVVFSAPPVDHDPTAVLSGVLTGPDARKVRISFDVRVDQSESDGAVMAFGPNPFPSNVSKYFISIRVEGDQYAYNAGAQLDGQPEDVLFQPLGGNLRGWTHFDIEYDVDGVTVDIRLDGIFRAHDVLPVVPATGVAFDIGLVELSSTTPWRVRFDNVSVAKL